MANIDEVFAKVQIYVNNLDERPTNSVLLELYALYKQGSVGDVSGQRPGMLNIKARAKYDAWKTRSGMDANTAKKAYINLVSKMVQESKICQTS